MFAVHQQQWKGMGKMKKKKNEDVYAVQLRPQAWKCMLCGLRVQTKMQEQLSE